MDALTRKLILTQLEAVIVPYREWIDESTHLALTPRDPYIKFHAVRVGNVNSIQWIVNWNNATVVFESPSENGECLRASIDIGGVHATYGEMTDVLAMVTAEIYYQLTEYAKREGFPPENIMY